MTETLSPFPESNPLLFPIVVTLSGSLNIKRQGVEGPLIIFCHSVSMCMQIQLKSVELDQDQDQRKAVEMETQRQSPICIETKF